MDDDKKLIDDIIEAEGGSKATNDPVDRGGRTQFGIAEKFHPAAWADGKVTYEEAAAIYRKIYILAERFNEIKDTRLRHQVVDFGVLHGADRAARLLQQVAGVEIDGEIGPKTLEAVENYPAGKFFGADVPGSALLNLAFRDARITIDATIAKKNPSQLRFLLGWVKRALEFK